jgi:hypothetical protein
MPRGMLQREWFCLVAYRTPDPRRGKVDCVTPLVLNILVDFRESTAFSAGKGGGAGVHAPRSGFSQPVWTSMREETCRRHPSPLEPMARTGHRVIQTAA